MVKIFDCKCISTCWYVIQKVSVSMQFWKIVFRVLLFMVRSSISPITLLLQNPLCWYISLSRLFSFSPLFLPFHFCHKFVGWLCRNLTNITHLALCIWRFWRPGLFTSVLSWLLHTVLSIYVAIASSEMACLFLSQLQCSLLFLFIVFDMAVSMYLSQRLFTFFVLFITLVIFL